MSPHALLGAKIGRSPLPCKARLCSSARHTPTVLASAPLWAALKYASKLDSREPRPEAASSKACCFFMPLKGAENNKSQLERTKCQAFTKSSPRKSSSNLNLALHRGGSRG